MNLNTPEKVDKNRRVAWAMYYELMEENRRLRKQIDFLNAANRNKLFRLFQLIRRTPTTPELKMLGDELRREMYFSEIIGISRAS